MKIEDKINEVLNTIRPFLISDSGNVEFVKYEKGVVYVKLLGACSNCGAADLTIESMVQEALSFEIPEVIKVVNVKE